MAKNNGPIESFENTEEEMTVTVSLDDGRDVECAILSIFEHASKDYIALLPLDEDGNGNEEGEYWIYGYKENPLDPNEEPELIYIDNDEEYEAVIEQFEEFLDNAEFDELL